VMGNAKRTWSEWGENMPGPVFAAIAAVGFLIVIVALFVLVPPLAWLATKWAMYWK